MFGYCVYFYVRSNMSGFLQLSFFIGYNACLCYAFFLIFGAISFRVSLLFVRHIYHDVKREWVTYLRSKSNIGYNARVSLPWVMDYPLESLVYTVWCNGIPWIFLVKGHLCRQCIPLFYFSQLHDCTFWKRLPVVARFTLGKEMSGMTFLRRIKCLFLFWSLLELILNP